MNPLGSSFNAAVPPRPPAHARLQKTNHMTSFGIIPLLKCFFKNATVVKLYSKGKFFFHVYLSHLVDLLIKNYVRSSGGCRGGDFYTKLRPEGPKKNFWDRAPPLSQGLDERSPLLSESLDQPLRSRFRSIPLGSVPRRQSTWYESAYRMYILDLISRSLQFVSYWIKFFSLTD